VENGRSASRPVSHSGGYIPPQTVTTVTGAGKASRTKGLRCDGLRRAPRFLARSNRHGRPGVRAACAGCDGCDAFPEGYTPRSQFKLRILYYSRGNRMSAKDDGDKPSFTMSRRVRLRLHNPRTLRAAHARAARAGPRHGIPHAEILPMVPLDADELELEVLRRDFIEAPAPIDAPAGWAHATVGYVDPRIAHYKQEERLGYARSVPGCGRLIAGEVNGVDIRWVGRLLRRNPSGKPALHQLVDLDGRPIDFRGGERACRFLNEIAGDPWGWQWSPAIAGSDGRLSGLWTFHVNDPDWDENEIRVYRQIRGSVVTAAVGAEGVTLWRGSHRRPNSGGEVLDADGKRLVFSDLPAARRHVEDQTI